MQQKEDITDNVSLFTDQEMTQYMESFEINNVNKEITDHKMNQCMKLFGNNAHKGIFQSCTLNNPVFNISIKIAFVCSYSFFHIILMAISLPFYFSILTRVYDS